MATENKENAVVEGGHEEYGGIAVGIIANAIQFAMNAIEKILPYPQTFQFETNLAIQVIIFIIPIAALLALVQGIKNKKKGMLSYFIGFLLVGLVFVYAKFTNPGLVIDIINPIEFIIDAVVLAIVVIIKWK